MERQLTHRSERRAAYAVLQHIYPPTVPFNKLTLVYAYTHALIRLHDIGGV